MVKDLFLKLISLPYGAAVFIRNKLFDFGILRQRTFNVPIISVGNLSTGGTGKTPMIEWLINELEGKYKLAILSRGYRRKTVGFNLVNSIDNTDQVGDEPLQIKTNNPDIIVAVCESRVEGINKLLNRFSDLDLILLDDAFQHRYVKPTLSILLTDYNKLFTTDSLLPAGSLREPRANVNRADIIIVTKCNPEITQNELDLTFKKIKEYASVNILHSGLYYSKETLVSRLHMNKQISEYSEILCVTGIANANELIKHLNQKFKKVYHLNFGDHYTYKQKDIDRIINYFNKITTPDKAIITTQKDWMRLKNCLSESDINTLPIFIQPVKTKISEVNRNEIIDRVEAYVRKN